MILSVNKKMNDDEIAKSILLDRTCDWCKHDGRKAKFNYMGLKECHYWLSKDRKHPLAMNPPSLPEENTCDKWNS